jgi:hypothetical protein
MGKKEQDETLKIIEWLLLILASQGESHLFPKVKFQRRGQERGRWDIKIVQIPNRTQGRAEARSKVEAGRKNKEQ